MPFTILHIDSSPLGEKSTSRKLTSKIVAGLQEKHADSVVLRHDLIASPLSHLDPTILQAFWTPQDQRDATLTQAIAPSDQAVDNLLAADVIVLGVPMWNFGIPSTLKAWVDHIVRAGRTFQYAEKGPKGLLSEGKKVVIASSRGGIYSEGAAQAMDHQESYLKAILGFLGISSFFVVRAEGMNMGDEAAHKGIETAEKAIAEVLHQL